MSRKRIGPKMEAAAAFVERHPGCHPIHVARHVGPRGSLRYGYATVHRAVAAGLVRLDPDPEHRGRYRCYPLTP